MSQTFGPYTWVTDSLAVGPAPMTEAHFALLRQAGIGAILNLCAEFPQLPDLQRQAGFEVYFLPVPDEGAPDLDALEQALAWLDEALYLGKKVLIHCRFGIGRTGTVLNAYLLRRGLGHRRSWWALRRLRSKPTNFAQWRAVRRYGKVNPCLEAAPPSLTFACYLDLSAIWDEYRALVDAAMAQVAGRPQCGIDTAGCCRRAGDLGLTEAAALAHAVDTHLDSRARRAAMLRATAALRRADRLHRAQANACPTETGAKCPLLAHGRCLVPQDRPLACRLWGLEAEAAARLWEARLAPALEAMDRRVWTVLAEGVHASAFLPRFSFAQVVSGRWVPLVFAALAEKRLAKGPAIS